MSSVSDAGHAVRWRPSSQVDDDFYTPPDLADALVGEVGIGPGDVVLDPFRGPHRIGPFEGAVRARHPLVDVVAQDIVDGPDADFSLWTEPVDWAISNPPWSAVDAVIDWSTTVCSVGFAYLIAAHAVTPARLQRCKDAGFGLRSMLLFKVFEWYGIQAWCVWVRGHVAGCDLRWSRRVYRSDTRPGRPGAAQVAPAASA